MANVTGEQFLAGMVWWIAEGDSVWSEDFSCQDSYQDSYRERSRSRKWSKIDRYDLLEIPNLFRARGNTISGEITIPNILKKAANFVTPNTIRIDKFLVQEYCCREEAGAEVNGFFDSLDLKKYLRDKNSKISEGIKKIVDKTRVLIISRRPDDEKAFIDYGFSSVKRLASVEIAKDYIRRHPEELYDLLFVNKEDIPLNKQGILDPLIIKIRRNVHVPVLFYGEHLSNDGTYYKHATIRKGNPRSRWDFSSKHFAFLLDEILTHYLTDSFLEKIVYKNISSGQIASRTSNQQWPPRFIEGLNILIYAPNSENYSVKVGANRNSKVIYGDVANPTTGNFDIIIVDSDTDIDENVLQNLSRSSREMYVVVRYHSSNISDTFGQSGQKIKLNYEIYPRNLFPESHEATFHMHGDDIHKLLCVIGAALNFYNTALRDYGESALRNLVGIPSVEQLNALYKLESITMDSDSENNSIQHLLKKIYNLISIYLKSFINEPLGEGLEILRGDDITKVEWCLDGRLLFSIKYKNQEQEEEEFYMEYDFYAKDEYEEYYLQGLQRSGISSEEQTTKTKTTAEIQYTNNYKLSKPVTVKFDLDSEEETYTAINLTDPILLNSLRIFYGKILAELNEMIYGHGPSRLEVAKRGYQITPRQQ